MNFLFLDADARPIAMGGAYTALASDANALLYNPAGLAFLNKNQVTLMHAEHFQGVTQEYASVALRGPLAGVVGKNAGTGFMLNTVSFGGIQRTTLSNPRGTGLDPFGIRDWTLAIGYGRKAGLDWVAFGANLKYLREDIDSYSAQAMAADLGLKAELQKPLNVPISFGFAIQNMGTKLKYQASQEDLPLNLKVGVSYRFLGSATLALDLNQPKDGSSSIHVGTEYVALKSAAIRFGYNGRNEAGAGITFGGGIILEHLGFDYAFVPFGDLGNSHRFSLSYRW